MKRRFRKEFDYGLRKGDYSGTMETLSSSLPVVFFFLMESFFLLSPYLINNKLQINCCSVFSKIDFTLLQTAL